MVNIVLKNIWSGFITTIAVVILLCSFPLFIIAEPLEEQTTDLKKADLTEFVLVLDCSGSMKDSDPDGLLTEAAELFVNLVPPENTCLGIIVFGDDYGGDSYVFFGEEANNHDNPEKRSRSFVKAAYPITRLDEEGAKDKAIQAIYENVSKDGELTPIGFALEAAIQELNKPLREINTQLTKEGKPRLKGNGAIILLTDGRVDTGDTDDGKSDKDKNDNPKSGYNSIDNVTRDGNGWLAYCMELNIDGKNTGNEEASFLMREHIPSEMGHTKPILIEDNNQAFGYFNAILDRFYNGGNNEDKEAAVLTSEIEEPVPIEGLVAVENITITGSDIDKVVSVEVRDPDGNLATYEKASGNVDEDNRTVKFDAHHIMLQLIVPKEGIWNVTVHVANGEQVRFNYYPVAIQDIDLKSEASREEGEIEGNGTVGFKAYYTYGDRTFPQSVYEKYRAKLVISGSTNDSIEMDSKDSSYQAEYQFARSGSYNAQIVVEAAEFRKESKVFNFRVDKAAIEPIGEVLVPEMRVNGDTVEIEMSEYFANPDGDKLNYTVNQWCEEGPVGELHTSINDDGLLSLTPGNYMGEFTVEVIVHDEADGQEAIQTFNVSIVSEPLRRIKDADIVPIKLVVGEEPYQFDIREYFQDPDGGLPRIQLFDMDEVHKVVAEDNLDSLCYQREYSDGVIYLTGKERGNGFITIYAYDSNDSDSSVIEMMGLKITVQTKAQAVWSKLGPVLCVWAVAIAIILLLIKWVQGKAVLPGMWNITYQGSTKKEQNLGLIAKKGEAGIDNILLGVGFPGFSSFGNKVKLKGNSKGQVVLLGGNLVDKLFLNGTEIGKKQAKKGLRISRGSRLRLKNDNSEVTLERKE